MKFKSYLLLCLSILSALCHAQQLPNLTYLTFDNGVNSPANVELGGFEMLYKNDTNTFVQLGFSYGNSQLVDVDFSPNNYVVNLPYANFGYFILKTDSNYVPISHKLLLCTTAATNEVRIENTRTDKDRNLYVLGSFSGTIDFYPGDSTYNRTSIYPKFGSNPPDYFIAKYDTALNLIWVKTYKPAGNTSGIIQCIDFEVARDGSAIYFTPATQGGGFWLNATQRISNTMYPGALVKLDANGDLVWFKTQASNPAYPITSTYRFRLNSQNEIIMAGHFAGTMDLDWGAGQYLIYKTAPISTQVISANAFLAKYDADGVFLDALVINAPTYSSFYNFFKVGKNDDIVVITDTYDYFAPNPLNPSYQIPNMTNGAGYACYDKNLNFLWAGVVSDPLVYTNSNSLTYSPILQDAENADYYFIFKDKSAGYGLPIVTKVDGKGVLVYRFKLSESAFLSPVIHNRSLLVSGLTDGWYCDVNPSSSGINWVSRYSTFVAKYSDYVVNGVSTHAPLVSSTSIYPTPATHELVVERSAGSPPAAATLYDLWGRVVLATTLTQPRSQIGVGELPSGFYVLRIAGEGRSYKVVVQR